MLSLWLNLFLLAHVSLYAHALTGDSSCGVYLCINATVIGNKVTYEMTPHYWRPMGWMALGWGRFMRGSHMMVVWHNEDGTTTLSQRFATGHTEPTLEGLPLRPAKLVGSILRPWQAADSPPTVAFEVELDPNSPAIGTNETHIERLIWAYSLTNPGSSDPNATLHQHYAAGRIAFDYEHPLPLSILADPSIAEQDDSVASVRPPPSAVDESNDADMDQPFVTHERIVFAHGILLSSGFLLLLPLGSLIARWSRTFTPKWFRIHRAVNFYVGLPVILVGWILGPVAVMDAQAAHFMDAHQICGFMLLLLYFFQIYMGRYIHARRSVPKRPPHPPTNIIHVFFGLLLIIFAFMQVRSGLEELEMVTGRTHLAHWCHAVWNAWAVALPILYFAGLSLLRRQFHQEQNGITPGISPSHYVALSPDADSPIGSQVVFDAEVEDGFYKRGNVSIDSLQAKEINEGSIPLLRK